MKHINVKCKWCNENFDILLGEYNRQVKKGRNHFFCSRSCSCRYGNYLKLGYNLHDKWFEIKPQCVICNKMIPFEVWKIKKRKLDRNKRMVCSNKECKSKINSINASNACISEETRLKLRKAAFKHRTYLKNFSSNKDRRTSSKGERQLRNILKIKYGKDKVLAHRHFKIGNDRIKAVDMYLPDYKVIIEYDGEHHFRKIYDNYDFIVEGDMLLEKWCLKNNHRLIRIDENVYKKDKYRSIGFLMHNIVYGKEKMLKIGNRYK